MAKKPRRNKVPNAEEILGEVLEELEGDKVKGIIGRPVAIQSPIEMEERIIQYLNDLGRWKLPTKAGLSFALGVHRETLNQYEKKEGFSDILKHWYQFFEDAWVQNLARPNATGTIFYLKNTYGYVDNYNSDLTSGGRTINFTVPQAIAEKHGLVVIEAPKEEKKEESVTEAQIIEDAESAI